MDLTLLWLAVGAGFVWHGGQILWVAPLPRQLRKVKPPPPQDSARAFQAFWIDQYGWIGIVLVVSGLLIAAAGALS